MRTLDRAGVIVVDSRWRRVCGPFLLRWFPYFFSLLLLASLPCGVRGQTATPAASNPPAAASTPAQAPAAPSAAAAEDIRDIRGPISIPSPWRWLWLVAGVTAVLGLLYSAWRWYRLFAAAKAKQPYEVALERLEKARALMKPEQAREYSFAVSEITRDYIECRFGEHAARRTTDEFLHDLVTQSESPLAAHQPLLEDFLRHCDLAKFARWQLDLPQMESMHESARTFITWTRPQPEVRRNRDNSKNGTAPQTQPTIVGALDTGRQV